MLDYAQRMSPLVDETSALRIGTEEVLIFLLAFH